MQTTLQDFVNLLGALFWICFIGVMIFIFVGPIIELAFQHLFGDFFEEDDSDEF